MDLDNSLIKVNPYFRFLSKEAYSTLIQQINPLNLSKNEILFREGDFADAFYIVKEGAIRVTTIGTQGETIFLARIAEEGFFGEQAFSPATFPRRQASAKAQVDTILYKIPREALLALYRTNQQLQDILQKKNLVYLRQKLDKLANNIQSSSSYIKKLTNNEKIYPQRSIIFFQNEKAQRAFILVSGEVELRNYDQDKQLQQTIEISPGQMFGSEGLLSEEANYNYTAVAKHEASVLIINISQYNKAVVHQPFLKQLYTNFNQQFILKAKGKIIQFRSEYLEMASITSIILLNDGREIICQQTIGADIFFASLSKHPSTRKVIYNRDQYHSRALYLEDDKIVELLEYGLWEDSYKLLDLMIDDTEIAQKQLNEFSESGRITIHPIESTTSEKLVCKCMRVPHYVISKIIASGASKLDEISQKTGAGTVCGGCKPDILEMLGMDVWIPCVVSRVIDHNAYIKAFQFKPTNQSIPPFEPGQYLVLKVRINNSWVQRSYTLTSAPNQSYFEITVKKEPNGLFSPWLFEQSNNDFIIYASGPYGKFTLESTRGEPIICFMGGIGVTPAIAFIRHLVKEKIQQQIYVDYSATRADQFISKDELNLIAKEHPNITINYRTTNINGPILKEEIKRIILSINKCHVYTCGPEGLEKLITESFSMMNLPQERLHIEKFVHAGSPDKLPQTISFD